MKKISVIIPCYNAEKYLNQCMDAVVAQTVGLEVMEIILVNDGSEDATLSIMMEWEKRYSESVLLINCEQNCGVSAVRNLAMSYAGGEYVAFMDVDDNVAPHYLERLKEIADTEQSDIVLCRHVSAENEFSAAKKGLEEVDTYDCGDTSGRKEFLESHISSTAVWAKLFRRSFIEEAQLAFPEGVCYEDTYFTYMAYMQANRISKCQDALYRYCRNMESITLSGTEQRERNRLITLRMFYGECIKRGWAKAYYEELGALFVRKYYVEMTEVMFRKFEIVDYPLFCGMRDWLLLNFPDIQNNPYLTEEKYAIEQFFMKFIYNDFDNQQLLEMRSVFLQSLYQINVPLRVCATTYRISTYPAMEDMRIVSQMMKDAEERTQLDEMFYEALTCIPYHTKEHEIAAICQEYSLQEKAEYYQYVLEREAILAGIKEDIRKKSQNEEWIIYGKELLKRIEGKR